MTTVFLIAPEDLPIPPTRGGSVQIYLNALTQALNDLPSIERKLVSPSHGKLKISGSDVHATISGPPAVYQRQFLKLIQARRPDVVQIDNRPAWVQAVKAVHPKGRIVLNMHSTTFLGPMNIPRSVARRALQTADGVVLNSHYLKRTIAERFRLQEADWHPHVIYPGVELTKFSTADDAQQNGSHPLRLLFVGRIVQQKGIHVIVSAVQLLKQRGVNVELTIVGRTPPWERAYGNKIERRSRGLPIVLKGFVAPNKIASVYRRADVLLCPSQRDEAFGLVNVEAMACGRPVIASRLGGISEIVTPETGVLVEDFNKPQAFADAIAMLARQPERRAMLGVNAQKRAAAFTWSKTAHAFAQLYTAR